MKNDKYLKSLKITLRLMKLKLSKDKKNKLTYKVWTIKSEDCNVETFKFQKNNLKILKNCYERCQKLRSILPKEKVEEKIT